MNTNEESTTLEFTRTVSRGRNTYGYTIITLYANGVRVARCSGGGYDMRGTVLGDYIQDRFQIELLAIRDRANYAYRETGEPKLFKAQNRFPLYGMTFYESHERKGKNVPPHVALDGATGFSSMEAILKALGYHLSDMKTRNREIFILTKD